MFFYTLKVEVIKVSLLSILNPTMLNKFPNYAIDKVIL